MTYYAYVTLQFVWLLIACIAFLWLMVKDVAPYGRHVRKGFGPEIDNRLGWVLMEAPVMLFLVVFYKFGSNASPSGYVWGFMGLFLLHYLHRSFVFPLFLRTKGKKMPVTIVLSALGFNFMNGFGLGYYFGSFADYPLNWLWGWQFWVGIGLFFTGMGINLYSDYYLITLRKPAETDYKIPQGGLFRYVSCPNLLGELIEWGGYALLTWSLPGLVFWIWSMANLVPRALAHHQWYKKQFTNYPATRTALLPGIL